MTLSSIAHRVGVHVSLVSRVLRNDKSAKLSDTKRAHILAVAKEMGYRPNRLGRSLRTGQTFIIAMLTPDITNPFHAVLFRGVEAAAAARGYDTILCNTDERPERVKEVVSMLSEGHVDGILVATAKAQDESIDWLAKAGLPFLLVNRRRESKGDPWIGPSDVETGWLGASHLLSLGHRRIAFLFSDLDLGNNRLRHEGVLKALAEYAGAREACWINTELATRADAKAYVGSLLSLPPERRPTAFFSVQTVLSDAAVHAIYESGLRIPDDISVVGYSASETPDVTSVVVPIAEIGRLAAEKLIDMLGNRDSKSGPENITVPVKLVDRGSTASPADR